MFTDCVYIALEIFMHEQNRSANDRKREFEKSAPIILLLLLLCLVTCSAFKREYDQRLLKKICVRTQAHKVGNQRSVILMNS